MSRLAAFIPLLSKSAEIAVSKVVPAGAGWQSAATFASQLGFSSSELGFFMLTGLGDGGAVLCGHFFYNVAKRQFLQARNKKMNATASFNAISPELLATASRRADQINESSKFSHSATSQPVSLPNLKQEAMTGAWLGAAAIGAGCAWQPALNFFIEHGFPVAPLGTAVVCGSIFWIGLRLGRCAFPIEKPNPTNRKQDLALSAAIGGGAGTFVGTDVTVVGNFLEPVLGIQSTDAVILGVGKAGAATGSGFLFTATVRDAGTVLTDSIKVSKGPVENKGFS